MKVETIHKELEDLSSNETLKDLFHMALDVVTRNGKKAIDEDSMPLFFLLGAMLPVNTILLQAPDGEQLNEIRKMVVSATEALSSQGCHVCIQDENGFLENPPEEMDKEERQKLAGKILDKLVARVCKNMPEDVKIRLQEEMLLKMNTRTKFTN